MSMFFASGAVKSSPQLFSELSALTEEDYAWIGAKIYQNEAASSPKYLTHWGKGENFPSFGIAHFIWFPNIPPPPYQETFPAMFEFVSKKIPPPLWLQRLWKESIGSPNQAFNAPWHTKAQFDAAQTSRNMQALRQWLLDTQAHQAHFIVKGFQQRWGEETASLSVERLKRLNQRLNKMAAFKQGLFSIVDYFNFKGLGNNSKEKYQGRSWGLISVLEGMPQVAFEGDDRQILKAFIASAKRSLQQRTELAPKARNESRWLKGWFKRLDGYAE
ncbi:MAG: hypothetical protein L3J00_03175 [Thiomicrorhabdus sp.]|nr:hypothetical protein [Thiomicrorhabdus sp.]